MEDWNRMMRGDLFDAPTTPAANILKPTVMPLQSLRKLDRSFDKHTPANSSFAQSSSRRERPNLTRTRTQLNFDLNEFDERFTKVVESDVMNNSRDLNASLLTEMKSPHMKQLASLYDANPDVWRK